MAAMSEVSVDEIITLLINRNYALLDSLVSLLKKIESDVLATTGENAFNGEAEELIRLILQVCSDTIKNVLSLQEQLQTRFVESYFPAQD